MPTTEFLKTALAIGAGLGLGLGASAASAAWPEKPVTVIVAYAAGGSSDLPTRAVVDAMNAKYGTNIVVENRAGAAGSVGLDACAKATPDGYTFCTFTPSSMCILPNLRTLPFSIHDFETVGRTHDLIQAFSTPIEAPWKTIPELVEAAKAKPGALKMGSSGVGTTQHLLELAFIGAMGIDMTHVPYGQSAEMVTDTLAGRLALIVENTAFEQYRAGKIRIMATTVKHPSYPELPVITDFTDEPQIEAQFGFFAPKGTPQDIIAKFSEMLNGVLAEDSLKAKLLTVGGAARPDTPADMRAAMTEQCAMIDDMVKRYDIKAE